MAAPATTTSISFKIPPGKQLCPKCGNLIGILAGSMDAICQNCGFKDPCCE